MKRELKTTGEFLRNAPTALALLLVITVSIRLVNASAAFPGRRSDLQMHRTPSAFGDFRVLFVSDAGRTVS
jgi:hypothetical protein